MLKPRREQDPVHTAAKKGLFKAAEMFGELPFTQVFRLEEGYAEDTQTAQFPLTAAVTASPPDLTHHGYHTITPVNTMFAPGKKLQQLHFAPFHVIFAVSAMNYITLEVFHEDQDHF